MYDKESDSDLNIRVYVYVVCVHGPLVVSRVERGLRKPLLHKLNPSPNCLGIPRRIHSGTTSRCNSRSRAGTTARIAHTPTNAEGGMPEESSAAEQ